jgi:hypothetical protein
MVPIVFGVLALVGGSVGAKQAGRGKKAGDSDGDDGGTE